MNRFSEEEARQREREARSRERMQRRGSREVQRYDQDYYVRQYQNREQGGKGRRAPRRRRRRRWPIVLLLVVVLAAAAGFGAYKFLVRAPELPQPEQAQSQGVHPGLLGAGRREGVYTFLLVGRDDGGGGNTDTIMVGCFDTVNGTVDVLNIFRDTLVDVPWEIKKINSVYNQQGLEGLQEKIKDLIGYVPDYYFVVELEAVEQLVDAIGGVDYEVPHNMDYDDPTQDLHIHFQQGMQHLDGADAVRLLRWRKNNSGEKLSVGDIGRVEIQQSFLKAMLSQTVRLGNITKLQQIANIVTRNLDSNLKYGEMIWFGEQALGIQSEGIHFHSLPGDYTGTIWSSTYQNYQSYVFADGAGLLEIVNNGLNPYLAAITSEMQHVITGSDVGASRPSGAGGSDLIGTGSAAQNNTSNSTGSSGSGSAVQPVEPEEEPEEPVQPSQPSPPSTQTPGTQTPGTQTPSTQTPGTQTPGTTVPDPAPEPSTPDPEPAPQPDPVPDPAPAPAPDPTPAPEPSGGESEA